MIRVLFNTPGHCVTVQHTWPQTAVLQLCCSCVAAVLQLCCTVLQVLARASGCTCKPTSGCQGVALFGAHGQPHAIVTGARRFCRAAGGKVGGSGAARRPAAAAEPRCTAVGGGLGGLAGDGC